MAHKQIDDIIQSLERFLLGKRRKLEYAVSCLLAEGHLLIEDVPGVGKTTLAKSLANCIDGDFKRVQFTSDLLPSDLIGVTVYHQRTAQFEFQGGPIFTNVLLADEINRANPKTQSALLEAMHDAQISHDGKTSLLPDPFFVVATQNGQDHHGTFPLPESQLDRFLMKIHLGYPEQDFEKRVISGDYETSLEGLARIDKGVLKGWQQQVRQLHMAPDVLQYIYQIIKATREHPGVSVGVSPRGGQALYRASQSLAFIRGRDFVTPDDVHELVNLVLGHRILLKSNQFRHGDGVDPAVQVLNEILESLTAVVPR